MPITRHDQLAEWIRERLDARTLSDEQIEHIFQDTKGQGLPWQFEAMRSAFAMGRAAERRAILELLGAYVSINGS